MNNTSFIAVALGILLGEIIDFFYDILNERNIEGSISLLHWLEHYHWGMIFLVLYEFPAEYLPTPFNLTLQVTFSHFMLGFGLSLILDENRSDTKFAWEKGVQTQWDHFYESSIIGFMIGIILVLRWLHVPLTFLILASILDLAIGAIILKWKPFKQALLRPT
jgi:hypothetical protein